MFSFSLREFLTTIKIVKILKLVFIIIFSALCSYLALTVVAGILPGNTGVPNK
jgi:hypothetical protein